MPHPKSGKTELETARTPNLDALAKESLALCREAGDKEGLAFSFVLMGEAAWYQGDLRQTEALYKDIQQKLEEFGKIKADVRHAWKYQLGVLFGLTAATPEKTLYGNLEYEF